MRFKGCLLCLVVSFVFISATGAESGMSPPARVGGTVKVNGTLLSQGSDEGYSFVLTKQDNTPYSPVAQDSDGLTSSGFYVIDIPIYDPSNQPGGANPGDTAVIHVFKDSSELVVLSPTDGRFTVVESGSVIQLDLTAVSVATQYILTVNTSGLGSVSPSGGSYDEGTVVELRATPAAGWVFMSWSGGLSGSDNPGNITMNSNKGVTATFSEVPDGQYSLTVNITGQGSVSPFGGSYNPNAVVELRATAAAGWQFDGWSGDLSGASNPANITMNSNKGVTATFSQVLPIQHSLTVSTSGQGSVSPSGGNYDEGTVVQMRATAAAGWQFDGWSGDLSGASNPANITMNSNKGVTATFSEAIPVISSFKAMSETINKGESTSLSWSITGAVSASVDNGVGEVNPSNGSIQVSPAKTTTYRLTATNGLVDTYASCSITVVGGSPVMVETIPHDGAGIDDSTRIPNNVSFSVLIADSAGINITDIDSIRFTVDDGDNVDEIDLDNTKDVWVRLIKLNQGEDDMAVTQLWAVYYRAEDDLRGNCYPFDREVNLTVAIKNVLGVEMIPQELRFKIESEIEHDEAALNSPETDEVGPADSDLEDPEYSYDAGIEVTTGDLQGAKIIYNRSEPVLPTFGPEDEIPPLAVGAVGVPMNLQPPTVFITPVKIFIPCPGVEDVSSLGVYFYNGTESVLACGVDGNVQPDAAGWMVPGSRVNHSNGNPSTIEIKIYHFSAAQAGTEYSSYEASLFLGGCFITTSAYGSLLESPLKEVGKSQQITLILLFMAAFVAPLLVIVRKLLTRQLNRVTPSCRT
jgi:uncharacterized repeat protein (TIGR02543 family)